MAINITSLKNLKPNKSGWNNSNTCVIRIPEILKDEILNYAHKRDKNDLTLEQVTQFLNNCNYVINKGINKAKEREKLEMLIRELILKTENKESGYKSNSASKLIKELRGLINDKIS